MKKLVLLLILLVLLLNTGIVFAETINYYEQFIYDIVMKADAKDREFTEAYYRDMLDGQEVLGVEHEYAPFSLFLFNRIEAYTKVGDFKESINYDGLEFFIKHTREIVENTGEAKEYLEKNLDYSDPNNLIETPRPFTVRGNMYYLNSLTTYGDIDLNEVLIKCNDFNIYLIYFGDLLDSNLLHKDISFNIIPTSYLETASKDSTDRNTLIAVSGPGLQPVDEIKAVMPSKYAEPSILNKLLNTIFYNVYTSTIFFFILFTIIGLIRKRISKNKKANLKRHCRWLKC